MAMKKFLLAAAAALCAFCVDASAQQYLSTRWGITGGFTSSSTSVMNMESKSASLYNIGLAAEFPLGGGLAIQPALLYQVKGLSADKLGDYSLAETLDSFETKVGYLEIPVQVQWGPDLILFRPYLMAEPFVGFALNSKTVSAGMKETNLAKAALNKMEYGLGLGGGVEIWRLQVSARYYWNFGSLCDSDGSVNPIGQEVRTAFKNGKNFNGFSLSAALFF